MSIVKFEEDKPQALARRLPVGFNKDHYDIVAVIEAYGVVLENRGAELWALCPFHGEQTPSFSVNPEKQVYHCHGCHAGGTVADFVAAQENISRYDAALLLMGDTGSLRYDEDVLRRKLAGAGDEVIDHRRYIDAIYGLMFSCAAYQLVLAYRGLLKVIGRCGVKWWDRVLDYFGMDNVHRAVRLEAAWYDLWNEIDERAGRLEYRGSHGETTGLRRSWDVLYSDVRKWVNSVEVGS